MLSLQRACHQLSRSFGAVIGKNRGPRVGEAKSRFGRVVCEHARDANNVPVEGALDVVKVRKDEGPFRIDAAGDDVLGVLERKLVGLLKREGLAFLLEKEFLVVGELDDEGDLEDVLKPAEGGPWSD
jgi:hypothetical protein